MGEKFNDGVHSPGRLKQVVCHFQGVLMCSFIDIFRRKAQKFHIFSQLRGKKCFLDPAVATRIPGRGPPPTAAGTKVSSTVGKCLCVKKPGRFGGWVLDVWQHHTVRRHLKNSYVYNKFSEVHGSCSLVKQYISHILTHHGWLEINLKSNICLRMGEDSSFCLGFLIIVWICFGFQD